MSVDQGVKQKHEYRPMQIVRFVIVHLMLIGIIFTGISWASFGLCMGLYFIRMFAVTAGYHRYFSHKAFKTSRVFQFILAFLAQTSAQQGVLWWANHHRQHHVNSDTAADQHSPKQHGFWHSHVGWIFAKEHSSHDYEYVNDFKKFPEIVWLDKHPFLPAIILGALCFWWMHFQGLFVGFFLSTVLLYHGTFTINSLSHVFGRQRYLTGDYSRNNALLAIITLGEGWHNNHHYYPGAARQGFYWWEYDITYYILKILSWCHIVSDLKQPDPEVLAQAKQISGHALKRTDILVKDSGLSFKNVEAKLASLKEFIAKTPKFNNAKIVADLRVRVKEVRKLLKEKSRTVGRFPPKLRKLFKLNIRQSRQQLKQMSKNNLNEGVLRKTLTAVEHKLDLLKEYIAATTAKLK